MDFNTGAYRNRIQVEVAEEWVSWGYKIPALQFPPEWQVKILPPFMGAMVRFAVLHKNIEVSVYLDALNRLRGFPGPYWEVYPVHDSPRRVEMGNTSELMAVIGQAFLPPDPLEIEILDRVLEIGPSAQGEQHEV